MAVESGHEYTHNERPNLIKWYMDLCVCAMQWAYTMLYVSRTQWTAWIILEANHEEIRARP